ncbi:MAG: FecR domain-containing protein [Bacteroidota bacterium]
MKTENMPEDFALLQHAKPPFELSRDESWDQLLDKIEAGTPLRSLTSTRKTWFWAIAASVLLLGLSLLAANQYSESYYVPLAQQDTLYLPDSSQVILRAGSKISFRPLWWPVAREVQFEGEAFFSVKKGSQFRVVSQAGQVQVLGTRFQINTFGAHYDVYCQAGRVGVSQARGGEAFFLAPGERLFLVDGRLKKESGTDTQSLAWLKHQFYFDRTPIAEVLAEIERSYAIEIQYQSSTQEPQLLSAAFDQPETPREALRIICKVFDLSLKKITADRFHLIAH